MNEDVIYATNVQCFRAQDRLSQAELAEIIGVSSSKIRDIETGKGSRSASWITRKLERYFGVTEIIDQDLTELSREDRLLNMAFQLDDTGRYMLTRFIDGLRADLAAEGHYRRADPLSATRKN